MYASLMMTHRQREQEEAESMLNSSDDVTTVGLTVLTAEGLSLLKPVIMGNATTQGYEYFCIVTSCSVIRKCLR